jgi:hypothetical protein
VVDAVQIVSFEPSAEHGGSHYMDRAGYDKRQNPGTGVLPDC